MFKTQEQVDEATRLERDDPLQATDEAMMTWATAQVNYRVTRGYPSTCSTCREAVSGRQWESEEEVIDARQKAHVVSAVTGAMDSLDDPLERAVLWQVYANAAGPAVWRNGRLAAFSLEEVKALYRRALRKMQRLLGRRGLVV